MKRCLLITFYFPPFEGIASLRTGKFAKFLPEFGWEPLVLTVDDIPGLKKTLPVEMRCGKIFRTKWFDIFSPFKRAITGSAEKSVEKNLKGKTLRKLVKILKSPFEAGFVRLPDRTMGWIIPAVRKGLEIIKEEKPDVLLSSGGPVSSHIIASILSKKSSIPWIADYRDLWTGNYFFKRNFIIDGMEKYIEKFFIKRAKAITTVSDELGEYLRNLHKKEVHIIANGFDEDDYKFEIEKKEGKIRLIYTGNIYPGKRDIDFFFRALRECIDETRISSEEVSVEFHSSIIGKIPELIERFGLKEFVRLYPFLPYNECRKVQKSADLLLILESPEEIMKGVATGKIFEYLAAEKPILAIGPKGGAIDRILEETKGGVLFEREEDLKDFLKRFFSDFKKEELLYAPDKEKIKRYSRRYLTGKLAEAMERVWINRANC